MTVTTALPDGTEVHLSVETQRNRQAHTPARVDDPLDPARHAEIRANHALVNDLAFARHVGTVRDGRASWSWTVPAEVTVPRVVVKAWAIAEGDVHQAATLLDLP